MDHRTVIKEIAAGYLPLSDSCQDDLVNVSELKTYPKSYTLAREGEHSTTTYYVVKGSVRAFYLKEGRDVSDWFAFDGEFITSIRSFFLGIPSEHFLETTEDSLLLTIEQSAIIALNEKYLDFERLCAFITTQTMLSLQQRVVSIQFETALQRYQNLLDSLPDIEQRIALTHIASYLGITLETLSRVRAQVRILTLVK